MVYSSFMLNGDWEMDYSEDVYLSEEDPFKNKTRENDLAGTEPEDMSMSLVLNAVPGYWEDMVEKFKLTPFFSKLKVNPEYGIQSYPIAGNPPDMALPNIMGNFFYKRNIIIDEDIKDGEIHFDGVMNAVSVWINEKFIGRHCGYSAPFGIKIPEGVLINGENTIVLSVSNLRLEGYAGEDISGLTSRAANEYSGGITGNVEIRSFNSPLRDVSIAISEDTKKVFADVKCTAKCQINWEILDGIQIIKSGVSQGSFYVETDGLLLWSPEEPKLYTIKVYCENSFIEQKFGIRRLTAEGYGLKLNAIPYYLRGACEHGYFPETVHPAHDKKFYLNVIKKLKRLGFNFIRFHTYVPEEEYMQAADELGMLIQVECPNNTTVEEWEQIVDFCKKHTSVVIYCCGNELLMDDAFIEYLRKCADIVHQNTDSLFAPMSAMRGLEYFWCEPDQEQELSKVPFIHHPRRIKTTGSFSDLFCSYPNGAHSYFSLDSNYKEVDHCSSVYNKPRLSHEICIDGTYTDLSVKDRYKDLRIGKTDMFSSIERHLKAKGVFDKASLYFKNSSQWQRRIRKYCFENVRKSRTIAGYDFLGPIDTHWHTFGYDVGMMNEFYELKPGETVKNVLRYNNDAVLLSDTGKNTNYLSESNFNCSISISNYRCKAIENAKLTVKLNCCKRVYKSVEAFIDTIEVGTIKKLAELSVTLPKVKKPKAMRLSAILTYSGGVIENEWELYLFPEANLSQGKNTVIVSDIEEKALLSLLKKGKDVLLLGTKPFPALPTSFRIALAGRTSGNVATVIYEHPLLKDLPNDGFCGWQFVKLLEGGSAVCFECENVPFNPIIEIVSTHKYVVRQSALFEFSALNGRLIVCGFNFDDSDPAANWLKGEITKYMESDDFSPKDYLDKNTLQKFIHSRIRKAAENKNVAFNQNDKTAVRKWYTSNI